MATVVEFPNTLAKKEKLLTLTPYAIKNGALCYEKVDKEAVVTERLCNFVAWQQEKRIIDDGSGELQQQFLMRGQTEYNRRLPDVEIPASQFAGLAWITANWSPRAIIRAGYKNKDQLREAIELLSQDLTERHIYTHTGWRQINGQWCFLHGGGAVGLDEPVEVMLAEELSRYILPGETEDIDEALQASLRTLDVGKNEVTYPLVSNSFFSRFAVCRALLNALPRFRPRCQMFGSCFSRVMSSPLVSTSKHFGSLISCSSFSIIQSTPARPPVLWQTSPHYQPGAWLQLYRQ
jgi:hypothetical protein